MANSNETLIQLTILALFLLREQGMDIFLGIVPNFKAGSSLPHTHPVIIIVVEQITL